MSEGKKVFRVADIPDSHKIKVYDALCKYFADALDPYYTNDVPTDPRYDSGVVSDDDPPTHVVGLQVDDGGELFVLVNVKGWADLQGFSVALPVLDRSDNVGDGWIDIE